MVEYVRSTEAPGFDGTRFVMQTMDFYVDNVTSVHDFWGSSVQPSHEARNRYPKVLLTAVNLANFLLTRFVPDDYVVVKMDIEAAGAGCLSHADVKYNAACCFPAPPLPPCCHVRNTQWYFEMQSRFPTAA